MTLNLRCLFLVLSLAGATVVLATSTAASPPEFNFESPKINLDATSDKNRAVHPFCSVKNKTTKGKSKSHLNKLVNAAVVVISIDKGNLACDRIGVDASDVELDAIGMRITRRTNTFLEVAMVPRPLPTVQRHLLDVVTYKFTCDRVGNEKTRSVDIRWGYLTGSAGMTYDTHTNVFYETIPSWASTGVKRRFRGTHCTQATIRNERENRLVQGIVATNRNLMFATFRAPTRDEAPAYHNFYRGATPTYSSSVSAATTLVMDQDGMWVRTSELKVSVGYVCAYYPSFSLGEAYIHSVATPMPPTRITILNNGAVAYPVQRRPEIVATIVAGSVSANLKTMDYITPFSRLATRESNIKRKHCFGFRITCTSGCYLRDVLYLPDDENNYHKLVDGATTLEKVTVSVLYW
eukprot:PhM_4_TR16146/c0_g1_i2/m.31770